MTKNYAKKAGVSTQVRVPQMVKVREDQIKNNAGGYVFKIDDMERLRRFLILGTEGGTYYVAERKLTADNTEHIANMLDKNPYDVIDEVVEISHKGRAAKNDPAIFVMALAATHKNQRVRSYALKNLNGVCRIATHLFTFATFVKNLRKNTGWGTMLRRAFANWYNNKEVGKVAYQICKYPSRAVEGEKPWNHGDILRKAHIVPKSEDHSVAFRYAIAGHSDETRYYVDRNGKKQVSKTQPLTTNEVLALKTNETLRYMVGHIEAKHAANADEIVDLIKEYGLVRESIPNNFYNTKKVMDALVQEMPLTATIRLLNVMTNVGTLAPMNKNVRLVCDRLTNEEQLIKARIHPIALLAALRTYDGGCGFRGKLSWEPISQISDALEDAFYKSFKYVEPTGKSHLLAVDVSDSMTTGHVCGLPMLVPCEAAAAMAMTIARIEPNYEIMGFSHELRDLGITAKDRLNSALTKTSDKAFGGTDCSLPIQWAIKNKVLVDVFVVITDNETWFGRWHVHSAMEEYRRACTDLGRYNNAMGRQAKLVAIGMTATQCTIGDNEDPNTLNVVGFDANAPALINEFVKGNI